MQYSGEMLDGSSGLYDLRARQYDASTGRFLSQDPLADSGQTAGTYIYADDNPNIYNDPAGTCYRGVYSGFGGHNGNGWDIYANRYAAGRLAYQDNSRVINPNRQHLCNDIVNKLFNGCTELRNPNHDGGKNDQVNKSCWNHVHHKLISIFPNLWSADPYGGAPILENLRNDWHYYEKHPWEGPEEAAMLFPVGRLAKYGGKGLEWLIRGVKASRMVKITVATLPELKVLMSQLVKDAAKWAASTCIKNSFPGDTPVAMADGSEQPIRNVKVGDKVLATDPVTGETSPRPVTALIREHEKRTMVDLRLSDGSTITATDLHPFWDASTGTFIDAIDLPVGDQLLTDEGLYLTVTSEHSYVRELKTYNLTIAGIHTYYAGTTPVLVHNMDCGKWATTFIKKYGGERKAFSMGGRLRLGKYELAPDEIWFDHTVVVKGGRVFEEFVVRHHPNGMLISDWKKLWQYGDHIDFGF
jgi:RHS repeat-associated protein